MKPLHLPIILGTPRRGRRSAHVARFVKKEIEARAGVVTELIDIIDVPLPVDGAGKEIQDPGFAAKMDSADGLVLVTPEYNHGFPGLLKHLLDTCLAEYIHKPAGIVAVSAGPWGGTRVVESFLPVLRELGLITTFTDLNVPHVGKTFDADGNLLEPAYVRRAAKFVDELVWMATVLRHGRSHVPQETA